MPREPSAYGHASPLQLLEQPCDRDLLPVAGQETAPSAWDSVGCGSAFSVEPSAGLLIHRLLSFVLSNTSLLPALPIGLRYWNVLGTAWMKNIMNAGRDELRDTHP